jgi:outer membrane protein TolC
MSIQAAKEDIGVSMAKYIPTWGVDVSYGRRTMEIGGEKIPDLFSAILSFNLPIFNTNLQDKWLAASKNEYMAAQYSADDQLQELKQMLHVEYASWQRFGERVAYYKSTLIPKSEQNAKAALMAYQSQVSVFTALMRARLKELKTKLQALNLVVDHTIAQVDLLYLLGEGT